MVSARTLATRDSSTVSHNSICRPSTTPGLPPPKSSRIHFYHSRMRLHYVPLLAAAALVASAHGRQAVVGAPEARHQAASPAHEKGGIGRHLRSHDDSDDHYYNGDSSDYSSDTNYNNNNNNNVIRNGYYNWKKEDRSLFSDSKDTQKGGVDGENDSSSSVSSSDISSEMVSTKTPFVAPAKRRDGLDSSVKQVTNSVDDNEEADN